MDFDCIVPCHTVHCYYYIVVEVDSCMDCSGMEVVVGGIGVNLGIVEVACIAVGAGCMGFTCRKDCDIRVGMGCYKVAVLGGMIGPCYSVQVGRLASLERPKTTNFCLLSRRSFYLLTLLPTNFVVSLL